MTADNSVGGHKRAGRLKRKYGKWALVTGASSGIGREFARELAKEGFNVVAVARREAELGSLETELRTAFGVDVRAVYADLTVPEDVAFLKEVTDDVEIGLLIPNAGVEITGELAKTDMVENERLVRLNVLSPMAMAHHYGSKMIERKSGAILFVASTFGYQGVPFVANYAASKAYVLSLGEALRYEMAPHGIDVTVLSPGLTSTDMPDRMPIDFKRIPMKSQSAEHVARFGLRSLERRRDVAVPGLLNKVFVFQNRIVPRRFPVWLFGKLLSNAMTSDKEAL